MPTSEKLYKFDLCTCVFRVAGAACLLAVAIGMYWLYMQLGGKAHGLGPVQYKDDTWKFIGGICALYATCSSFVHILRTICSRGNRALIGCILRILLIVPICAIDAFVCLHKGTSRRAWPILLEAAREVYEAIVLVSFVQFIVAFLGGPKAMAAKLSKNNAEHLWLMRVALRLAPKNFLRWAPGSDYCAKVLVGILQYAYVMIFLLFAHFLIWVWVVCDQNEDHRQWQMIAKKIPLAVKMVSNGWAMYCLVLWYHELLHCKETSQEMKGIRPFNKFGCVKGIVLLTVWQNMLISGLVRFGSFEQASAEQVGSRHWSQEQIAEGLKNFLLCVEMVLFAEWHKFAYPMHEWKDEDDWYQFGDFTQRLLVGDAAFIRVLDMRHEIKELAAVASEQQRAVKVVRTGLRRARSLNEEQLVEAFRKFDCDEGGKVSLAQLKFFLCMGEGMTPEEADALLQDADADGNGMLSQDEFVQQSYKAAHRKEASPGPSDALLGTVRAV